MQDHPLGIQPWGNSLLGKDKDVRTEGLGVLSGLSDEIMLELLSELTPQALSRLSCCSKALYCFCSHDELWKAFVLNLDRAG